MLLVEKINPKLDPEPKLEEMECSARDEFALLFLIFLELINPIKEILSFFRKI